MGRNSENSCDQGVDTDQGAVLGYYYASFHHTELPTHLMTVLAEYLTNKTRLLLCKRLSGQCRDVYMVVYFHLHWWWWALVDCTVLYWAVLGFTWLYWSVQGCTWLFWNVVGCIWL